MSSASPNRLKDAERLLDQVADSAPAEDVPQPPQISAEDELTIRSEKLAAVKKAIDEGAYDSDEILNEAMARMLDSIEREE